MVCFVHFDLEMCFAPQRRALFKAEQGRGREKRKIRRKKSRRERVRRKKMQMREKVGKSRNTVFFQWFGAPEGRKVGSLKRRVRSHLARWEMTNCTPLWREAHFQVKMYKTHQVRTTFGSWDVEKVYGVVARSTFRSENVQNTSSVHIVGSLTSKLPSITRVLIGISKHIPCRYWIHKHLSDLTVPLYGSALWGYPRAATLCGARRWIQKWAQATGMNEPIWLVVLTCFNHLEKY